MSLVGDDSPRAPAPARAAKANPFGAARPREQVIAEREGKRETEVLKEQAQRDWKPQAGQSVLTDAQYEEKKALEAELAYAKSDLEKATDPARIDELKEEVALKEQKLQELLASFEKMSVRPVRREWKKDEAGGYPPQAEDFGSFNRSRPRDGGPPATGHPESQDYGNFSRGGGRGGRDAYGSGGRDAYGSGGRDAYGGGGRDAYGSGGRDAYGSAWSGGSRGSRDCYNCGQPGHISRDCPSGRASYGGSFGGGRAGGRDCYNCHEEGHLARDCPREPSAGGGGGFGGGYQEAGSYRQDSGGVQGGYDQYARGR